MRGGKKMAQFNLMTEEEIQKASEFDFSEETSVDALSINWKTAAKVALGVAGAFL